MPSVTFDGETNGEIVVKGVAITDKAIAEALRALPGAANWLAHDAESGRGLLSEAMVRFAARHEMARTVEDVLARRSRLLFLDAAAAGRAGEAVAEILRFTSPQQIAFRYALEEVQLAGTTIRRGQTVGFGLGAANRDPAVFPDPDRFDVTRHPNHPLSFAAGIHYCLGANLARLEGRVVFDRLTRRFADIAWLDNGPDWRGTLILRGVPALRFEKRIRFPGLESSVREIPYYEIGRAHV